MDRLEIALQEEMQLRVAILKQPLEGLLYDLDLMPEQCKGGIANIRKITVEVLRKEIERLRKLVESAYKEGHFDASEDISLAVGWYQSIVKQALKEKE